MGIYRLLDVLKTTDRYKLFVLEIGDQDLDRIVTNLSSQTIKVTNIGKELSAYIDSLEDFRYLTIDVYDFLGKLLDERKSKLEEKANDVIVVFNLGILFEPVLELNAAQVLKDISKEASVIILWEGIIDSQDRLCWPTQKDKIFFDFNDVDIKKLSYAI